MTYLAGDNKGNSFKAVALASDYKIAPGLITYSEVAYATGSGLGINQGSVGNTANSGAAMEKQKFSGTSFLIGLKVKF